MNRRELVGALAAVAGVPRLTRRRLRPEARFVERWSWAMGQSVHLQLYADSEERGYEAAAAALAELRRVEARLSLFDDASDLSELNRRAGRRPMRAGADLLAVLVLSRHYRRRTWGAFDVAVEPLMRAWGFHRARATPPTAREIAEARAAVRAAEIRLDGERAFLPSAHSRLDFGGIGVGYGMERAGAVLRAHRITRALLDVSGDVLALGSPPGEPGWRVGIADPGRDGGVAAERVLRDAALATSSNRRSVVRYGALVVGHVMDPATGQSAPAVRQATVIAASAVRADALSTAALVTGRLPGGASGLLLRVPPSAGE